MRLLTILAILTLLFSCKQQSDDNKSEKKDFSNQVEAICTCVKSYKEFEEKSELLKFTNTDADLINDVVALEIQMNICLAEQLENYKKEQIELNPLIEKACPAALKLLR